MSGQRLIWLIFPVALIVMSVWLIVAGPGARIPIALVLVLSIFGCVRQVAVFWTKGRTTYVSVTLAAVVIGMAVALITFLRSP